MFLRVLTTTTDSDSLKFRWKDDVCSNEPPETYQMQSHIFGAKDSQTIANYVLKRIARDNFSSFDPLTSKSVLSAFYMGDFLGELKWPNVFFL